MVLKRATLHHAANKGKSMAVQALLKHHANIHARGNGSWTALHQQFLLEHRADADAQDDERATPLNLAVANGKTEAARLLLERDASIHARNKDRQAPFQKGSETGSQEIMELLRDHMLRQ